MSGIYSTCSDLRVLNNTARAAIRNTAIEMLRLCPGDNQGQRDWMGTLLLKANRPADALSFLQHWLQPDVLRTGGPPPRGGCVFEAPSPEPLSSERAKKMGKWTQSSLVYTAALAAFTLWGDCELARQYLVIATKLNPAVLLKVLAKVDRPSELFALFCVASCLLTIEWVFPWSDRITEHVRSAIE